MPDRLPPLARPLFVEPLDSRRAAGRLLRAAVAAVAVAGLAGCGGGSGTVPQTERPTATQDEDRPVIVEDEPAIEPTTRPGLKPTAEPEPGDEVEPATNDAATTTRPADGIGIVPANADDSDVAGAVASTMPADEQAEDAATAQPTTQPVADAQPSAPEEPHVDDLEQVAEPTEAGAAVADVLTQLASGTLRQESAAPALRRQAEALMTAAVRLAPNDARLARQLVDVRLATSDVEAAVDALDFYRQLQPDDRLAQLRYVDLSTEAMETADLKLEYLSRVAGNQRVPSEVRAHAAVAAAVLLAERLEDEAAAEMVARAVEFDPYNPEALRLDYGRILAMDADRPARVAALARLLRANVNQPPALATLAAELGAAGLTDQALAYYKAAQLAYAAVGVRPPAGLQVDQIATLLTADRPREALQLPAVVDPLDPAAVTNDVAVYQLPILNALAMRQAGGDDAAVRQQVGVANASLRVRLNGEEAEVNPDELASTTLPDVMPLVAELEGASPAARQLVAQQLAARASMDLYVLAQPTDARLLEAIGQIAPEGSTIPARLGGWQAWRNGDVATATEKLSAVAENDPLARLGLLLIRREQGENVTEEARQLLNANPTGLVGASIADAFGRDGVFIRPGEDAQQVREALAIFPDRLLNLLGTERVADFYSLTAQPLKVPHTVGEPMLARVILRNSGRDTLTLGPDGVLSPTVRVDAQVSGILQERIPAAAYAELAGRTRLEPGERIEQVIRIDGPQLAALLQGNPHLTLAVEARIASNPVSVQVPSEENPDEMRTAYTIGPAGQSRELQRTLDRRGLPLDLQDEMILNALNQRLSDLRDAEPLRRVRAAQETVAQLRWLAGHVRRLQEENAGQQEIQAWQQLGGRIADALRRAAAAARLSSGDAAETMADAWVRYSAASVGAAGERATLLRPLVNAGSFEARVVGLLGMATLVSDRQAVLEAARPLAANDPDPTVRRLARAVVRFIEELPAENRAENDAAEAS